jgi:hypothetical protein
VLEKWVHFHMNPYPNAPRGVVYDPSLKTLPFFIGSPAELLECRQAGKKHLSFATPEPEMTVKRVNSTSVF